MTKINGYTEEQVKAILEADTKRKERQKRTTQRQLAKTRLYLRKAKEMGITVTDEEIDEEINKR